MGWYESILANGSWLIGSLTSSF